MEHLRIERIPTLRDPAMVLAFSGWNDAGEAATTAVRHLIRRAGAIQFAEIDPEAFFVFTDTRPTVRLRDGFTREVEWPSGRFYYHRSAEGRRDLIIFLGAEPNLRWPTFTRQVVDLARQCGVTTAITLGALLADVPHTRPVRITGSAYDQQLAARLNLTLSRYEGPTGIVGVTHDAFHKAGLPSISIWANVPHYISASPNPKAAMALLVRLNAILQLGLDLADMEQSSRLFEAQVSEAVAGNPEVAAYVRQLEAQVDAEARPPEEPTVELPSGEALVQELEEFLRRRREEDEGRQRSD